MNLVSALSVYNKFTLPTTLVRGDELDIPITVVNNRATFAVVKLVIKQYTFNPEKTEIDKQESSYSINKK